MLVIESYRRDDGDRRGSDVGGVPPTSHPHFEHGGVDVALGKKGERAGSDRFEERGLGEFLGSVGDARHDSRELLL